jgi:hypothetical protein
MSKRKPSTTSQLVTKQALKQILQTRFERKQFTSALSADTALTTTGLVVYLNPIAQGDDITSRNGDVIQTKHLRLQFGAFDITGTQSNSVRLIVFSDGMANGAPAVTDVLETANFTSPIAALAMQRNRFHLYHDSVFSIVSTASNQEVNVVVDVPLNRKVYFNGITNVSGFAGKNALFMLIIAANGQGLHHHQWGLIYQDN